MTDPVRALIAAGQRGKAERLLTRRAAGGDLDAYGPLAEILEESGRLAEAMSWWGRRVLSGPPDASSRRRMLRLSAALGRQDLARAVLVARWQTHPDDNDAVALAGALARQQGQPGEALRLLQPAARRFPADGAIRLQLAAALCDAGRAEEAACHADAAAAALPGAPAAWALVAEVARRRGEMDAARVALAAALALAPLQPALLWGRLACIPAISPDAAHERALVARFQLELAELDAAAASSADAASWVDAACSAFPLHYRGGSCLDLQRPLGALLCRLLAAAYPQPPLRPPARARIRVGFVGEAFRRHTITKLFGGWMRGLDRQRFEVIGYHLGLVQDADSAALAAACDGWAALPGPLVQAISRIREDAPDVLIFPEVGMDDRVLRLAALRLAPLQAAAWGHPISTGLPTVDLFLSSAAMAPLGEHRWTTEERVDLPGIGVCVPRPGPPPALPRAALGLPDGPVLLLCVQSLFKYRPFSDALHVAVARGCPQARLVFIEDARPAVTRAFQDRLHAAFADAGLDPAAHLCWLPRLDEDQFMGLLALGDLFLDSPGWSGGNTTLEALSVGLPCLAFPGDTMRGRHCLAMVQVLELPELCPADSDAWVAAAVALAGDADRRAALRACITARADRLFDDPRSIRALEALLSDRVRPGPPR